MRRLAAGLALFLLVLAFMTQPAGALTGERGSGGGVDSEGGPFAFQARGTGSGDEATGIFRYTIPSIGVQLVGDITCMIVSTSGSTRLALMSGVFTQATDPVYVGHEFILQAQDGTTDGFSVDALSGGGACFPPFGAAAVASGAVTLVDA